MEKLINENDKVSENFELQLSEVEMLSSMYPSTSEFNITDPSVLADMRMYISGKKNKLPLELHFIIILDIQECNAKLDVNVTLPLNYPMVKPLISIISIKLNRHQHKELNQALHQYIESLEESELCIFSVITWLTENAQSYFSLRPSEVAADKSLDSPISSKEIFCRMWIYSHHIYSKFKRRDILELAQQLKLTGFSLPGKPGLICCEGTKKDCYEFYHQLKLMSWKKLSKVKEEIEELSESRAQNFRRFEDFQEISFSVRRGPAKEYHMDMGQFLKYLEDHNSGYAFHDLFGIEAHISSNK